MGNPFKAIVKVFKRIVKAVANIFTGFMGAFGMSYDTPEFGGGGSYEAQTQGITVNKQSNVAGIPVVYGRRKVGGVRVFVGTRGDDNKYLYVALAVAEGEIQSFKRIWINDELQSISNFAVNPTDGTTVDVASDSKYYVDGAKAKFQFFTGKEDQLASGLLKQFDSKWKDNHRLRGIAYVACRFEWVKPKYDNDGNQTRFDPWQGIPQIQVEIEGKKVLTGDYSSHSQTEANTYGADVFSPAVGSFAYSDNPADCLLDYLRNPRYGKGLKDHRINWTSFRQAQLICDTSATFPQVAGDGTVTNISQQFLNCNTYVMPEDTMFNNAKKLLQTCRGFLPYVNGQYQLKIETAETTPGNLLNITDDMIIGSLSVQSQDKNSKYNQAKVTFNNAEKDFEADTAVVGNSTYLAEDDGEDLILNIGAPGIIERSRALQYAEYMVNRSRKQLQVSLKATSEAQDLVAGDLVCITHRYDRADVSGGNQYNFMFRQPTSSTYSDPDKIFRVISQRLNYDGTVDLVMMEHQNNIYDVGQQQEDRDLSPLETPTVPTTGDEKPGEGTGSGSGDGGGTETGGTRPPQVSQKQLTVRAENGGDGPQIVIAGMKRYSDFVDAFVEQFVVKLTRGTESENKYIDAQNPYASSHGAINGNRFRAGDTVTVNISKRYANQNVYAVEVHYMTIPGDSSNTLASGSI